MNNTSKLLLSIAIVGVFVAGVLWYSHEPAQEPEELKIKGAVVAMGMPIDIIGTQSATTTTGEYFDLSSSASTTVVKRIGTYVDTVTFTIDITSATTTAGTAAASFSILGSNDQQCDTSTTTTSLPNQALANEIRWFDIGTNLLNLAGTVTLPTSTSTLTWTDFVAGDRTQIVLTDVNTECIAFQVSASTTIMQVQMMTRSNIFN